VTRSLARWLGDVAIGVRNFIFVREAAAGNPAPVELLFSATLFAGGTG